MNTTDPQCRRDKGTDLEPESQFMLRAESIMEKTMIRHVCKFTTTVTVPCKDFQGSARKHHDQIYD